MATREPLMGAMRHLLVDGHVHFHPCFDWEVFLGSAATNFSSARRALALSAESPGCLVFTEAAGSDAYSVLARGRVRLSGWSTARADEHAVVLERPPHDTIVVVPGRQIVTAERLEVLCAGRVAIADGEPVQAVLASVAEHGGVPVIPWGLGKWWGRRGRLVRRLMERPRSPAFCLGDNGGRAHRFPRPSLFAAADSERIPVLAGSDPLPLPSQVHRAGSYGFVLDNWSDTPRPAQAINERLRDLSTSPPIFGHLSSPAAMVRSQLGIRWRRRPGAVAEAA